MLTKVLIHVRGGSERVPNKNLRPFAGKSLLELKIRQLMRLVPEILSGVVVNSEDEHMLGLATSLGCETVRRDPWFARPESTANETWREYARTFPGELVVCTPVTSPLVDNATVRACLLGYRMAVKDGYDSVNTVAPVRSFLWLDGKPINYQLDHHTRSQDLPDVVRLTFGVSVIARELMERRGNVVGAKPYFVKLTDEEALDVDTPLDFRLAEWLYLHRHDPQPCSRFDSTDDYLPGVDRQDYGAYPIN